MVAVLSARGFVALERKAAYAPGPTLLRLVGTLDIEMLLSRLARPLLEKLGAIHRPVHAYGMLEADMVTYLVQVKQVLGRDPHAGDLFVFRGAKADLIKIVWHDGIGMSLYAKRLEKGCFVQPSPADGVVAISAAQLAYVLDYAS
ncbi:hypothetical protein GCM10011611_64690 [Aliidongia dinghuensis]|uniref:Transposase n=2 Tax=Aliidongia dinghuensis TaxID=1867774 RepID=A0A8J2Z1I0_9PROT|nr:hypothetical protein GCM10011611_64690 [Aliidongia dinghuensis]